MDLVVSRQTVYISKLHSVYDAAFMKQADRGITLKDVHYDFAKRILCLVFFQIVITFYLSYV